MNMKLCFPEAAKALPPSPHQVRGRLTAAYVQGRLIPQAWRALPAELFTKPSNMTNFSTFYEGIIFLIRDYLFQVRS